MARTVTDIRPARARAGHRLYRYGQQSECPQPGHKLCAYDGTEKDRCQVCHVHDDVGCVHTWGGIPPGSRACGCRDCGEIFASNSAFADHRLRFQCQDPQSRGLVLIERGEWQLWALAGERPPQ